MTFTGSYAAAYHHLLLHVACINGHITGREWAEQNAIYRLWTLSLEKTER